MQSKAYVIDIPLKGGYEAAGHRLSSRRGIIMKVTADGVSGWGEFVEIPGYSSETVETALATLTGAPVIHSNPMAVAARRDAEIDLDAKQRGMPLVGVLGGTPGTVSAGAVVARFGDLAGALAEVDDRVKDGYRKIKLKIGPGFDLEPLKEIRRRHPDVALAADANGAYQPDQVPAAVDELGLLYLEQPYAPGAAWQDFAGLRQGMATPICLDESITGLPTLRSAIAAGACGAINLKAPRLLGLHQALEAYELALAAGLGMVAGGLLETGIGRAGALALARLPGFTFPADLSASDRYWDRDLVVPPWNLTDGDLFVPDSPGIGADVDTDYLSEVTVSQHYLPT